LCLLLMLRLLTLRLRLPRLPRLRLLLLVSGPVLRLRRKSRLVLHNRRLLVHGSWLGLLVRRQPLVRQQLLPASSLLKVLVPPLGASPLRLVSPVSASLP